MQGGRCDFRGKILNYFVEIDTPNDFNGILFQPFHATPFHTNLDDRAR